MESTKWLFGIFVLAVILDVYIIWARRRYRRVRDKAMEREQRGKFTLETFMESNDSQTIQVATKNAGIGGTRA